MNCFICGEHFAHNIEHNAKDHRMWFNLDDNRLAFTSLELFDNIYMKDKFWGSYILYNAKVNEMYAIIQSGTSSQYEFIDIDLYWKNFKQLKSYIDKIMVFQ